MLRRDLGEFDRPADRPLVQRRGLQAVRRLLAPFSCIFCADTTDKVVALTFDDGPSPEHTPAVLDVLAERGATATFFVLTEAAERFPHLVRRIVDEGHGLALHGFDHRRLAQLPDARAVAIVADARERLEQVAGRPVHLFRPAYGAHTVGQLRGWSRLGLDVVLWSGWAGDWLHDDEAAVAERAVASTHPGGILLLHDARADPETAAPHDVLPHFDRADVLRRLLEQLVRDEYVTLRVEDLLTTYPRVRAVIRELMT